MSAPLSWRVRETRLWRRRGRSQTQLFLLDPPAGFAGRLRLGVIGDRKRTEYAGAWSAEAREPLVFEVPLSAPPPEGVARADLLFEIERPAAPSGRAELLPASVAGRPLHADARVYVLPCLIAPPAAPALAAMRRNKGLRLAIARACLPPPVPAPLAERANALAAQGRLAWIDPRGFDAAPADDRPTPAIPVHLPPPLGREAWGDPLGARLVAHLDACLAGAEGSGHPDEAVRRTSSPDPAVRSPLLGLWIERLAEARDLAALGRLVARCNRRRLSPRLLLATPADWLAARDELRARSLTAPPPGDPASR
ncbi:MAG: hypothetical protein FJY75_00680 [Candidatus Eisenbacteria bacterium]|uniref:Uncharacterized protein n=1 Tax=Eiseniibacteriota bacterium TaxID=2212470 RepID=A0A937X5R1_UNCEI|nr:hypothetical protein [Candidatus Eisenbacteria bacterium]